MNKKQWKAIYDYCEEEGYDTPNELLRELKACGVVDSRSNLEDLGEYPQDTSYESMMEWLTYA
jgi:hypothetical protein